MWRSSYNLFSWRNQKNIIFFFLLKYVTFLLSSERGPLGSKFYRHISEGTEVQESKPVVSRQEKFYHVYSVPLMYHIRPNYRTVRLGFSKLLGTLSCGKICIYLLKIHYKKDQKRTYLMMIMQFFLTFFIKAYVVRAHLNCIDKSMQFKWVPTTYAFIKK